MPLVLQKCYFFSFQNVKFHFLAETNVGKVELCINLKQGSIS